MCGGRELRLHDVDLRGHRLERCGGCGVAFLNPTYSDAYLARYYTGYIALHPEDAAQVPAQGNGRVPWRARPDVRREGKRRLFALAQRLGATGRALAVGCGDGLELEVGRELGFAMTGYDVDPALTAQLAARLGVPVHGGEFARLPLPDASFDLVLMDQVLEHLKEPMPYLHTVRRLLRPGGILLLAVPNVGSLANRWKTLEGRLRLRPRKRGKHYNTKHHVLFFTPRALRAAVAAAGGFEVLELRGSLKPQEHPLTGWLGRFSPLFDSGMLLVARRTATR